MAKIKALTFSQCGEPVDVLSLSEHEKPSPGTHEVLIKILASPIHPADSFFIQGSYRIKPTFPQLAGLEGTGIIDQVGEEVNLTVGALVSFASSGKGVWGQYVIVREENIIVLPGSFPIEKAAQFYLNPFTAWGLLDESGVKKGDWLLLTAANSTVSKIIIQLAYIRKIRTVAVVRNLHQSKELKASGANEVLEPDDKLADQILEITSGTGVHAAVDAVGGDTGTKVLQSMASGGTMVIYGLLSKDQVQFHNSLIIYKNLHIKGFGVRGYLGKQTKVQKLEMVQTLTELIADPSFQLPVERAFSLEQYKEAFACEAQGGKKGKIIFKPSSN